MRRLLIIGTSVKDLGTLKQIAGKSYLIDTAERLERSMFKDLIYSALILLMDDDPEVYMNELAHLTLDPGQIAPPVLVATRNPDEVYIRQALRSGALDFVDLNRHYFLVQTRINNALRLGNHTSEQSAPVNRMMFYRCMGPAMMLEVSEDESLVQVPMINNEFYDTVGIPRDFYSSSTNLLDTVLPEELENTKQALHTAVSTGISYTYFSNPATGGTYKGTYRLAVKGEDSSLLLLTLQDVTERVQQNSLNENLLRLPGMTLFSYDPETDSADFWITTKKNAKFTRTHSHLLDASRQKLIAPESFLLFRRTFLKALTEGTAGNIDVRILLDGKLTWFRMYYRSMSDHTGKITQIIGRLDDLESNDHIDIEGIHSGLCDVESHLPTFRFMYDFINQFLLDKKQGTLLLISIKGLDRTSETMPETAYQIFIQNIVKEIIRQFDSTDLIGRFDEECFMAFMPETTSRNVAKKKAAALVQSLQDLLSADDYSVNVGICIVDPLHGSMESIISECSIALWKAIEKGSGAYELYVNDQPD
ncbi:MAG: diguanylate cyclase [Lachnospiraceae bacterium]|nr:diguanylate cyclase [Lachnospiraceae bacterium]